MHARLTRVDPADERFALAWSPRGAPHPHRLSDLPDPAQHKAFWRPLGSPGALLTDGEVAGFWQAMKTGTTMRLTVTALGMLSPPGVNRWRPRRTWIARFRGARSAAVDYEAA